MWDADGRVRSLVVAAVNLRSINIASPIQQEVRQRAAAGGGGRRADGGWGRGGAETPLLSCAPGQGPCHPTLRCCRPPQQHLDSARAHACCGCAAGVAARPCCATASPFPPAPLPLPQPPTPTDADLHPVRPGHVGRRGGSAAGHPPLAPALAAQAAMCVPCGAVTL